jgi:LuxR family maltose regulon positive regulatory protein
MVAIRRTASESIRGASARHIRVSPAGVATRDRFLQGVGPERQVPLLVIIAAAGWGKTTALTQWTLAEGRPVSWLTIEDRHNDPFVFARDVMAAMSRTGVLSDALLAHIEHTLVQQGLGIDLTSAPEAAGSSQPFVLTLDDAHRLRDQRSAAILQTLIDHVPTGSQLVISGRSTPGVRLGRRRANRECLEIGIADLAMTLDEASVCLDDAGLRVGVDDVVGLLSRTEGWPAGMYLAALSCRREPDVAAAVAAFGGSDRSVAAYFREEVLADLSEDLVHFLVRASILDRLSGPVCDAVLGETGSGSLLEATVEAGNTFLLPLDRNQECYRFHRLFAEMLQAELRSTEPDVWVQLHHRASRWYEQQGDIERAVHHARGAGDFDRAGALMLGVVLDVGDLAPGALPGRWSEMFEGYDIESTPSLALATAWHHLAVGDTDVVEHWVNRASTWPGAPGSGESELAACVAVTRAFVGIDRVDSIVDQLRPVIDDARVATWWWPLACFARAGALLSMGEREESLALLERTERFAASVPLLHAACLAYLAVINVDDGDWAQGIWLADRARREVDAAGLRDYAPLVCVEAVYALVKAHGAEREEAIGAIGRTDQLLERMGRLASASVILASLLSAEAHLLLGDPVSAKTMLLQTEGLLLREPRAKGFRQRATRLQAEMDGFPVESKMPALTPAERRLLEFLPTHFTMAEIGTRLCVSRNTVKSHTIAVYRKLGASNRSEAVERAKRLGMLGPKLT